WIAYLHRVQAWCGEVIVDDSAQFNDAAVATVSVPATWTATDTTPDYYGGGYRWAPTQPAATDAAVFSFLVTAAGSRTLDARWTSRTHRATRSGVWLSARMWRTPAASASSSCASLSTSTTTGASGGAPASAAARPPGPPSVQ